MKKTLLCITACLLMSSVAFASDIDVSSLDFDTLAELKTKVDQEYMARPEAQPITMEPGFYTVGTEIKPGTYYFAYVIPGGTAYTTARMHVYENKEAYETRPSANYGEYISDTFFGLGEIPTDVTLEEGNYIWLENNAVMCSGQTFDPTSYYTYTAPEGTLVEKGTYNVSADIPEGKYTIYTADITGCDVAVYYSEKAKEENDYSQMDIISVQPEDSMTVELKEGYIVEVRKNAIMKKAAQLTFD